MNIQHALHPPFARIGKFLKGVLHRGRIGALRNFAPQESLLGLVVPRKNGFLAQKAAGDIRSELRQIVIADIEIPLQDQARSENFGNNLPPVYAKSINERTIGNLFRVTDRAGQSGYHITDETMRKLYQKSYTMRNSGNINRPFVRFAIPDPRDPVARAFLIASDILEFLKHEAEQTLSLNPEDEMDISAAAEDIDRLGPACIANVLVPSKTASKTPLYNYNCPLQLLRID